MTNFRDSLRQGLLACLAIGAAIVALFSLALLATAVTGSSTPGSVLLVGFGFILLILSVLVLIFAITRWTRTKPGGDT
jgi:uncharacterized membrane protein YidH (DUF202 family)